MHLVHHGDTAFGKALLTQRMFLCVPVSRFLPLHAVFLPGISRTRIPVINETEKIQADSIETTSFYTCPKS